MSVTSFTITLRDPNSAESFENFMRDDIFPAVPKTATRVGQVSGMRLYRGTSDGKVVYLWMIDGVMHGGPLRGVLPRIEEFGADVRDEPPGTFHEVAHWSGDDGS